MSYRVLKCYRRIIHRLQCLVLTGVFVHVRDRVLPFPRDSQGRGGNIVVAVVETAGELVALVGTEDGLVVPAQRDDVPVAVVVPQTGILESVCYAGTAKAGVP